MQPALLFLNTHLTGNKPKSTLQFHEFNSRNIFELLMFEGVGFLKFQFKVKVVRIFMWG